MTHCSKCGILLSRSYPDTLCPACREMQDKLEEEARIAAAGG